MNNTDTPDRLEAEAIASSHAQYQIQIGEIPISVTTTLTNISSRVSTSLAELRNTDYLDQFHFDLSSFGSNISLYTNNHEKLAVENLSQVGIKNVSYFSAGDKTFYRAFDNWGNPFFIDETKWEKEQIPGNKEKDIQMKNKLSELWTNAINDDNSLFDFLTTEFGEEQFNRWRNAAQYLIENPNFNQIYEFFDLESLTEYDELNLKKSLNIYDEDNRAQPILSVINKIKNKEEINNEDQIIIDAFKYKDILLSESVNLKSQRGLNSINLPFALANLAEHHIIATNYQFQEILNEHIEDYNFVKNLASENNLTALSAVLSPYRNNEIQLGLKVSRTLGKAASMFLNSFLNKEDILNTLDHERIHVIESKLQKKGEYPSRDDKYVGCVEGFTEALNQLIQSKGNVEEAIRDIDPTNSYYTAVYNILSMVKNINSENNNPMQGFILMLKGLDNVGKGQTKNPLAELASAVPNFNEIMSPFNDRAGIIFTDTVQFNSVGIAQEEETPIQIDLELRDKLDINYTLEGFKSFVENAGEKYLDQYEEEFAKFKARLLDYINNNDPSLFFPRNSRLVNQYLDSIIQGDSDLKSRVRRLISLHYIERMQQFKVA